MSFLSDIEQIKVELDCEVTSIIKKTTRRAFKDLKVGDKFTLSSYAFINDRKYRTGAKVRWEIKSSYGEFIEYYSSFEAMEKNFEFEVLSGDLAVDE